MLLPSFASTHLSIFNNFQLEWKGIFCNKVDAFLYYIEFSQVLCWSALYAHAGCKPLVLPPTTGVRIAENKLCDQQKTSFWGQGSEVTALTGIHPLHLQPFD